jgi:hypothetical protein
MYDSDSVVVYLGVGFIESFSFDADAIRLERIIVTHLMQYTGLKDKNGTMVFEGDRFKAPHCFGPAGDHEREATVCYDPLLGYQWAYWDTDALEVIGNIYENPELLEKA